ncbi:chromate transporter [Undibacterium sp. Jales W-56]|uniref:chromate transporter n=1 Tax=Undibacterium sp. Jales W-56 TaxID=2897325 RepID=UPI0039776140
MSNTLISELLHGTPALHVSMQASDWLNLLLHYMMLSLLSVGGAISTLPDMHRYLVTRQHWLSDAQFNASIALAQAAPGPNILFVALMGWNIGMNTGSSWNALLGMSVAMCGILIPSTTLTYVAANWGHRNRELRSVRAFKLGMAPIVVGLLLATGWIMAAAHHVASKDWPLWLLTAVCGLLVWRTRLHLLWLLALGAILGWFGLV